MNEKRPLSPFEKGMMAFETEAGSFRSPFSPLSAEDKEWQRGWLVALKRKTKDDLPD
jgi:hypothetical protein